MKFWGSPKRGGGPGGPPGSAPGPMRRVRVLKQSVKKKQLQYDCHRADKGKTTVQPPEGRKRYQLQSDHEKVVAVASQYGWKEGCQLSIS